MASKTSKANINKRPHFYSGKRLVAALLSLMLLFLFVTACQSTANKEQSRKAEKTTKVSKPVDRNPSDEPMPDNKIVIYQSLVRHFGNKKTVNKVWGTREENGVGKFNDYTEKALKALKDLGITHMYYTGVIAHALVADYSKYGIPVDDADVVKGRAGSPFAIKDYYDVNPDLAVDVKKRMEEFEALIKRTHDQGMKAIIDFVPNHVAREYKSLQKPAGVKDLGEDDKHKAFSPDNSYYYIIGQAFQVPGNYDPLGKKYSVPSEDGKFEEKPAKATGNDKFTASPSVNDWFETVKLNYGVEHRNNRKKHFKPIPATWKKMRDILVFWAKKGIDGMRCDMVEMVPLEFWSWVTPQVKKINPDFLFIGEIYNKNAYRDFIFKGGFSYLYDKVGLYDSLRHAMEGEGEAGKIYYSWRGLNTYGEKKGVTPYMLRFLENHDEQRIASRSFAGDPWMGVPGMTVTATLSSGPVMVYLGQHVGEAAKNKEGFSGADGRSSIFDYWGVPEHQKWMNAGAFDGGKLSTEQKKLHAFYSKLLNTARNEPVFRTGELYDVQFANEDGRSKNYNDSKLYSYLRYTDKECWLVVVNFDKKKSYNTSIKIPARGAKLAGFDPQTKYTATDALFGKKKISFKVSDVTNWQKQDAGISVAIGPKGALLFPLKSE